MFKAKYDRNEVFDNVLKSFVDKRVKPIVTTKDDDILVICIGKTGSGKSMLMLHTYEYYAGDEATIEYISFNRENLADNLAGITAVEKGKRFNGYDEANVSKRDAVTQFNKALLDVYYTIRGLNVFHWWNNPSLDMIDKPFIKDRVTGLFMITTHYMDRPRTYYYFEKSALLLVLKKYKNLDYDTLYKVRGKYAMYKGWFKDYTGRLKQPYLDKKNPRMEEKVADFKAKFGSKEVKTENLLTVDEVAEQTGYSSSYITKMRQVNKLPYDSFLILGTNNVKYKPSAVQFLINRRNSMKNLINYKEGADNET